MTFLMDILALITMSPWKSGPHIVFVQNSAGALLRLYNSAGRTSKAPKFCVAKFDCKFASGSFRAFKMCPAELWILQSAPSGGLMQCNMCPAFSWRHSYGGQNTHKNHLKLGFVLFFFMVIFCKPLSFRRSIHKYEIFLTKEYFTRWYL